MNLNISYHHILMAFVLFFAFAASGCVTEQECQKRESAARQAEREQADARVEAAYAETTKAKAETERVRAEGQAALDKLKAEAEEEKVRMYGAGYRDAAEGNAPAPLRTPGVPSLLGKLVFWLMVLVTVGALAAAVLYLIYDRARLTLLCKALAVPVSVYLTWRFLMPGSSGGDMLRLSFTYEPLAELTLLAAGFVAAILFDRFFLRGARRLWVDYVGTAASVVSLMHFVAVHVVNSELLFALGGDFALKVALAAPVGAAVYTIYAYSRRVVRRGDFAAAAAES